MSDSNTSSGNGSSKTHKRNLPSWMTSSENGMKSHGKQTTNTGENEENQKAGKTKQAKGHDNACIGSSPSADTKYSKKSAASSSHASNLSKLLEGVVFVLSGFVNPERSTLRSQAIEMGADYQADWNSNCTLLVCAFPNTPKFRQVEADGGTIVSKEWILKCYNQKKLVDIDTYLMHAGKPWRRSNSSDKTSQEDSPPRKAQKVEKASPPKPTSSTSCKSKAFNPSKEKFPQPELKKWAAEDLNKTIAWLESQEEKPEQTEIRQIAAEGILTCLQDVIDSLEQKQDIIQVTEQWQCIPHVVKELSKLDSTEKGSASLSKEDLCKQAKACKQIYEGELRRLDNENLAKKKKPKTAEKGKNGRSNITSSAAPGYDSEETIEMTEEEIELAYKTVTS